MSSRAENLGLGIRHRGQGPSFHALGIGEMAPNLLRAPGPRVTACAVPTPSRVLRIPSSSPAQPCPLRPAAPLWSSSWWFFSSFTVRWAWLPRAPSASSPELLPVTGGIPGGWRPDGWGGNWTGGPCVAWERCCAWSCCCCNEVGGEHSGEGAGRTGHPSRSFMWQQRTMPPKPLSPAQSTCCLAEGSLLMGHNLHTQFTYSNTPPSPPTPFRIEFLHRRLKAQDKASMRLKAAQYAMQ